MDHINNTHFQRVQDFIANQDNAYLKLRHEKKPTIGDDNPLPWRMELFINDDCIYYAAATSCGDVIKKVSHHLYDLEAKRLGIGTYQFDNLLEN